uniref:(northern house mosquito) hypothetical protein n=1 Tax=Culex pipiens TaxID=7175 RepID=A0A8D8AV54_CULPI
MVGFVWNFSHRLKIITMAATAPVATKQNHINFSKNGRPSSAMYRTPCSVEFSKNSFVWYSKLLRNSRNPLNRSDRFLVAFFFASTLVGFFLRAFFELASILFAIGTCHGAPTIKLKISRVVSCSVTKAIACRIVISCGALISLFGAYRAIPILRANGTPETLKK